MKLRMPNRRPSPLLAITLAIGLASLAWAPFATAGDKDHKVATFLVAGMT